MTIALTDVSDTVMAEHVPGVWEDEVADRHHLAMVFTGVRHFRH